MSLTQLELQRSAKKQLENDSLLPSCDDKNDFKGLKDVTSDINDDPLEVLQNQEEFDEMSNSRSIPLLTIDSSQENLSDHPNELPSSPPEKDKNVQQRSRVPQSPDELPNWVLTATQKLLGIATGPEETFRVATTLHVFTFATGLIFIVTYSWFIFYDISSVQSKRDALNGIVSIIICIFWTSLAVYANCLAYRMFDHQAITHNIRLHSKSVLKCNAAFVLFVCGVVFITLSDYGSAVEFRDETCNLVELDVIVCKIMYVSRVAFSFFAFLWNMLVAVVLLAVCRTHTIGIRKFLRQLQVDAKVQSIKYSQRHPAKNDKSSRTPGDVKFTSVFYFNKQISFRPDQSNSLSNILEMESPVAAEMSPSQDSNSKTLLDISSDRSNASSRKPSIENINSPVTDATPASQDAVLPVTNMTSNQSLSLEEILHQYWNLQSGIWVTSNTLQRWMLCFVCLCLIWIGVMLVHWLTTSPQALDVVLFVIPLVMLPILCSAYAEVNNESQRMTRAIYPSEERLWMLFYFQQAPLQMTIYGFPIKYSTVVTSIFGLVAALTSGIVLQEIKAL